MLAKKEAEKLGMNALRMTCKDVSLDPLMAIDGEVWR